MQAMKKGALLCAALTAVMALVLPAAASAAKLEKPAGTLVPKGTTLLLKSSHVRFEGLLGAAAENCEGVTLKGLLSENSGTSVKATAGGPGTFTCHSPIPSFIHVASMDLTGLAITRDASGIDHASMGIKVVQEETPTQGSPFRCTYQAEDVLLTYTAGTSLLHIGGSQNAWRLQSPQCGPGQISGDFTITDSAGNPIIVN